MADFSNPRPAPTGRKFRKVCNIDLNLVFDGHSATAAAHYVPNLLELLPVAIVQQRLRPSHSACLCSRHSRVSSPVTAALSSARRHVSRSSRARVNAVSPSAMSVNSSSIRATMRRCSASGGIGDLTSFQQRSRSTLATVVAVVSIDSPNALQAWRNDGA